MKPEHSDFASSAYLRAKSVWKGVPYRRRRLGSDSTEGEGRAPFGTGRDPRMLGDILAKAATDMGWSADLEQARVITEWAEFVGQPTSDHTEVVGVRDGVLLLQCDSTAWATELRRLRSEILTRLLREFPDSEIRDLRFLAPGAPSWRHGPRTVQGRGPRDTYG
ncbi:DciA family protein [Leucobacter iarius]|uniref:DciA family protein n=2 Tax=Microbacteriaceae TaxID=85023 RepID=A0ABN2L8B1_9MICO